MQSRSPGPYLFNTFEKVRSQRPTKQISFLQNICKGKSVLDIGCLDETAYTFKSKQSLLHHQIGKVAKTLVGVDNSKELNGGVLDTGYSKIFPYDIYSQEFEKWGESLQNIDCVLIAGVIEHLSDPIKALQIIRKTFPRTTLIVTTTNATGITNVIAAIGAREIQHKDHISTFSYKTLDNVIERSGYKNFHIRGYLVAYPEAKARLKSKSLHMRIFLSPILISLECFLNGIEKCFPLFSSGLIAICEPVRPSH
jgi:SAM-dependent methyltransferase